jgi:nucleotide-binding universal stress UspA family protein
MKILITIDYSDTAQHVAEQGYAFAKAMNAQVILLHVTTDAGYYASTAYTPLVGYTGYIDINAKDLYANDAIKRASQAYLDKIKVDLKDDSIQTIVSEGGYADIIMEEATKNNVDAIVMGSHSRRWLENIIMGSVTEEVLRQTCIPLYILPTRNRV